MKLEEIVERLHSLANPEKVLFKEKKFGIVTKNSLGIYHADLNALAKKLGKNSELAIELFDTEIYEARILCSKIFRPKDLTKPFAEKCVKAFDNWEICDSFSMGIFAKSTLALPLINEWVNRKSEFEKRAAFATMAGYCMADKKSENELFLSLLPRIEQESEDERLYVKKAVNWALRSIGKRNIDMNKAAIRLSEELLKKESKAAQWIANDAIRELKKEGVNILDYPRAIYRA